MGNFYFFISGFFAFVSYFVLVFFFLWYFSTSQKDTKEYTFHKNTTFSIQLIEETQSKKQPAKSTQAPKNPDIPIKKDNASKTANIGVGAGELFRSVETPKAIPQEIKPQSNNDTIAQKKKAHESSQTDITKELDKILTQLNIQKTMDFSAPKGEYDEFYAEVQKILYQQWNLIQAPSDQQAQVQIVIDREGRFSYKILKLSGNSDFNRALQEFLDIMLNQQFPKYEGGDYTNIIVTFKTEV